MDKSGRLVRFTLRPGNAAENKELPTLLNGVHTTELIADKAYDTDAIRSALAASGIIATIPPKANRKVQYWFDEDSYRERHLVENFFADLKQFRGIATRYCKLGESFRGIYFNSAAWFLETKHQRGLIVRLSRRVIDLTALPVFSYNAGYILYAIPRGEKGGGGEGCILNIGSP